MTTAQIAALAGIGVLLALSAFFSGSETALTATSRPRMHHLEKRGNRRARMVGRLIQDRERLIGAILLGNNAVNILGSALATSILISVAGDAGVAYATVGMTILILVFSEVLPKTYAIRHADRMALAVAPILAGFVWLLSPGVVIVQTIVRGILFLFGVRRSALDLSAADEELRGVISLQAQEGGVVKQEHDMLSSILDLDEVTVDEVMTHRRDMQMLNTSAAPGALIDQVVASPFTRLPLYAGEPENVIGVVHAKDLLRSLHANREELGKVDFSGLAQEPWFVPETTSLREQLNAFRARRAHFALVVDEYGSLMGLITLEDILEEIVGEIEDEHDIVFRDVMARPDGSFLVPGATTIRDLNRRFNWDFPDDEAATIAGLVLHEAQQIPDVGQKIDYRGFSLEVRGRQKNRITLLRVVPPAQPEDGDDNA
ncbi:MAG: HlyC/CorC family transporter [Alphaproteobacteria bacterium]|jgi:Mg2+/Co2+ transporter CorB|nr:HlyC/CorC family transporter [Alphaproteobacteria bacterium]